MSTVCVLTANGATVSQVLYNKCESVDVSSASPGVFAFPLQMKTHTCAHAHTYVETVQVLCVISGEKVKSASKVQ